MHGLHHSAGLRPPGSPSRLLVCLPGKGVTVDEHISEKLLFPREGLSLDSGAPATPPSLVRRSLGPEPRPLHLTWPPAAVFWSTRLKPPARGTYRGRPSPFPAGQGSRPGRSAQAAAPGRPMTQQLCRPLPSPRRPASPALGRSDPRPTRGPGPARKPPQAEQTEPRPGKGQPDITLAPFPAFRKITAPGSLPGLPSPA